MEFENVVQSCQTSFGLLVSFIQNVIPLMKENTRTWKNIPNIQIHFTFSSSNKIGINKFDKRPQSQINNEKKNLRQSMKHLKKKIFCVESIGANVKILA